VPLELYVTKNGRIKLKIGVGKVRKKVEKKQVIKERELKREMTKEIKQYK
jgi:SsrA-binding protein